MKQDERIRAYLSKYPSTTDAKEVSLNCDVSLEAASQYLAVVSELLHVSTREYNVGVSDYSKHKIQPWDIWLEYDLNPWDADIVKRILRRKPNETRLDYEKIKHICDERIRQIDLGQDKGNQDVSLDRKESTGN